MIKFVEIENREEWDGFINHAGGHPLQLWGWGELKESKVWSVKRVFIKNTGNEHLTKAQYSDVIAAAQILIRKLPFPLRSFAYIPRGIVTVSKKLEERARLANEISNYCKNSLKPRPVCLTIEPDWEEVDIKRLVKNGWKKTKNTILIPRTLILDLDKDESDLLADMNKKTRQYIRKSSEVVRVKELKTKEEIDKALDIYEETAKRAGFALHSRSYYHKLHKSMKGNSVLFGAYSKDSDDIYAQGEMVAFLWNVASAETSFELYGGVTDKGQKLRANYILKWLVIEQIRNNGVKRYDFNGLLNDGISKFKSGWSNHENMLVGSFDKPLNLWYFIWAHFLPMGKKIFRLFKK